MQPLISFSAIFQALVPKDKKFLPLFVQASANVLHTAELFQKALNSDSVTRITLLREVSLMERQGDEFTHVIIKEASSSFIIPFDREDITALAGALDDVLDYMHGSAKRIELYKIHVIPPNMVELANHALTAVIELDKIVKAMGSLKYTKAMQESIARIADLEKKCDILYDDAIAKLFSDEKNALEILKQKEVYSFLTTITDRCEDAAKVIESILVKFS